MLHAAAEGGSDQVITTLIRTGAGADKNTRAPITGRTPLHVAILGGKQAAAKALIMAGANANIVDDNGDSPLHLAIERGRAGLAENLLLIGVDHDVRGSKGDYTVHLAVSRGQDEVVLSLVQSRANLDRLDGRSKTSLAVAMLEDRVSTAKILLTGGCRCKLWNGLFKPNRPALRRGAQHNKQPSSQLSSRPGPISNPGVPTGVPRSSMRQSSALAQPCSLCCTWEPMSTPTPTVDRPHCLPHAVMEKPMPQTCFYGGALMRPSWTTTARPPVNGFQTSLKLPSTANRDSNFCPGCYKSPRRTERGIAGACSSCAAVYTQTGCDSSLRSLTTSSGRSVRTVGLERRR